MTKPIILTGIRSNSEPTLGNYLGAMLPIIRLQHKHVGEYQVNMFVPDLHSFTTPIDHDTLYANTIANIKMYVAAGLDISSSDTFVYRQSYIPAHSEMAWLLQCFIYVGELNRMTQFKEKSEGKDSVSAGLFTYPALMAADILLYDAKYVPVGEDQRQHLEITRDVALRMNHQFKQNLFTVPEPWNKQLEFAGEDSGLRIRSLKHPEFKMSKSVSDPSGTILLSDNPSDAKAKVLSATTDSLGSIDYNFVTQPGISNILQIVALLESNSIEDVLQAWRGKTSYGELKAYAADLVEKELTSFQARLSEVDERFILDKLISDEAKMNEVASAKLFKVQQAVGLREH